MTEQEAITALSEELVANSGFRARLQRGEALDHVEKSVDRVREALAALGSAWGDRECVPKEAVLAMTYVDAQMSSFAAGHSEDGRELEALELDLMRRIFRCLGKEA